MDRVLKVIKAVNEYFEKGEKEPQKPFLKYLLHTYGVAYLSAAIAKARGLDMELAFIIGILHDIGKLKTKELETDTDKENSYSHCIEGEKIAKEVLTNLNSFNEEEIEIICRAIRNHANKKVEESLYDEVIKDADVIEKLFTEGKKFKNKMHKRKRLKSTLREFELKLYNREP